MCSTPPVGLGGLLPPADRWHCLGCRDARYSRKATSSCCGAIAALCMIMTTPDMSCSFRSDRLSCRVLPIALSCLPPWHRCGQRTHLCCRLARRCLPLRLSHHWHHKQRPLTSPALLPAIAIPSCGGPGIAAAIAALPCRPAYNARTDARALPPCPLRPEVNNCATSNGGCGSNSLCKFISDRTSRCAVVIVYAKPLAGWPSVRMPACLNPILARHFQSHPCR